MRKRKSAGHNAREFYQSDGSHSSTSEPYYANDYTDFLSNGMTDNEKVEAEEYYEDYLSDIPKA